MELKIFNTALEPLGVIDEVVSLIWSATYWQQGDYGDCKILAPVTENNSELLTIGNIVVKHGETAEYTDDETGDLYRRAIQITYKHITKDENGAEQIEAQGCLLKRWLSKRVIEQQVITTATNQNIINKIVRENLGEDAAEIRQFENFSILPQGDYGGSNVEYSNEAYRDCGEEINERAITGKLGFEILVNERAQKYGFFLWKGRDLTSDNNDGNTPCIFSRNFDNVNELEYTDSIENIKNAIYVMGAADEENQTYTIEISDDSLAGIARDEVFLQASDISWKAKDDQGEERTITVEEYLQLLNTRGNAELDTYGETISFEAEINTQSNLSYKEDYDVGDIVTVIEPNWGIKIDARITKIEETYQDGKSSITATFGESMPTLIEKIKKVR